MQMSFVGACSCVHLYHVIGCILQENAFFIPICDDSDGTNSNFQLLSFQPRHVITSLLMITCCLTLSPLFAGRALAGAAPARPATPVKFFFQETWLWQEKTTSCNRMKCRSAVTEHSPKQGL